MLNEKELARIQELITLSETTTLSAKDSKELAKLQALVVTDDVTTDTKSIVPNAEPLQINVTSASIARDMVLKSPYKVPTIKTIAGMIEGIALIRNEGYNFERNGKVVSIEPNEYAKLTISTIDDELLVVACNDIFLQQVAKEILGVSPKADINTEELAQSLTAIFAEIPSGIELTANQCLKNKTGYYRKSVNVVQPHGEDHLQGLKVKTLFTEKYFNRTYQRSIIRERTQIEFNGRGQSETLDATRQLVELAG